MTRTTHSEELPLRPEYEEEWEDEEAEDEGEEEELETARRLKGYEHSVWKLHEGQIERIKAKDGEACALFVEENRQTIRNLIFKYLHEFPSMKAYFRGNDGQIEFDLFYDQLILDLPHLDFSNGGYLTKTMYRDAICKANYGFDYILTDAATGGGKLSTLYKQHQKAPETLEQSFFEDMRLTNKNGEEEDKHPLDFFARQESVADEYNADQSAALMTAEAVIEALGKYVKENERELLKLILQGVAPNDIQEILGLTQREYLMARKLVIGRLRRNSAEVVARLVQNGSTVATAFVGVFPKGYDEQSREKERARAREKARKRYADRTPEQIERERIYARERWQRRRSAQSASATGASV